MKPIQDSIQFNVNAETVVTNTTVKVTATIVGIVTPELSESTMKERIQTMMKGFITGAKWQFSGMTRSSHRSGMEEITLTATSRVPEAENYALDRRSRDVSVEGMTITSVTADTSPPQSMVEEAENSLRLVLLDKAIKQMKTINEHIGADYRLADISFGNANSAVNNTMSKNMMMSAVVHSAATTYGSGFSDESDAIGNAVKLSMIASVLLRSILTKNPVDPELERLAKAAGIK